MSFLKKLFGVRNIDDEALDTIKVMEEMANEAERAHLAMVNFYNKQIELGILDGSKSNPNILGIYKARLLATMYPAYMFHLNWRKKDKNRALHMLDVATGIAFLPYEESNAVYNGKSLAKTTNLLIEETLKSIDTELIKGPSKPRTNNYTDGFLKLKELSHDSLSESIGTNNYTSIVKAKFEHPIDSGVSSALIAVLKRFGKN